MAAIATIMQLRNAMKGVKFTKKFNKKDDDDDHHIFTEFDSNDRLDTVRVDTHHMRKTSEKSRILQIILGKQFKFSRIMINRKNNILILETINAFLAIFVLITALFEYELAYFPKFYQSEDHSYIAKENPDIKYWGMPVRVIQSLVCFITVIISIISNRLRYLLLVDKRSISIGGPIWKTPIFKHLLFDIVIDLIHPIPYLDKTFEIKQLSSTYNIRLQTILYIFTFLKVYIILRTIASHTKYTEAGMEPSTIFALKALQKDEPTKVLTVTLISLCVVLGIILRMIEMVASSKGDGYKQFANGIWNIIVAMTTVGYGDFFPESHFGRLIVVLSVFIGTLIISLTVVNLNYLSSFNDEEDRAYKILQHLNYRNELNDICQKIINLQFQLYSLKKSKGKKEIVSSSAYSKLNHLLKKESQKKLEIMRNLQDTFIRDIDKFQDLNILLANNLNELRLNLESIGQIRAKLKKQKINQIQLLENIEYSLKITRNHIKPMIYKMIYKHNRNFINNEAITPIEITELINVNQYKTKLHLKQLVISKMEALLFNIKNKIDVKTYYENLSPKYDHVETREFLDKKQKLNRIIQKTKSNLTDENFNHFIRSKSNTYQNMIENTIEERQFNENYNSKRQSSIRMDSLTSIEYQEKDPVYHQFEEFNKLTRKTKQIYLGISKQTFDVFDSLISLKKRNKKITQMPKKSNMLLQQQEKLGKEDILDSLIADIDIADDISELEINEPSNINQCENYQNIEKPYEQEILGDSKGAMSDSLAGNSLSRIANENDASLLLKEKEPKNKALLSKNINDASASKYLHKPNNIENKNNQKQKENFSEAKKLDQPNNSTDNKLDFSNFEDNKNDSNLILLKPSAKEINLNHNNININNNNKNFDKNKNNFFSGYYDNHMHDNDKANIYSDEIEEEKTDFYKPNNHLSLKNNDYNKNNYSNNNKNTIKKNFFEEGEEQEESKNAYITKEQDKNPSRIGFYDENNENIISNMLNLPESPEINRKNKLGNRLQSSNNNYNNNNNNNNYFDNNISVIQKMGSGNLMDFNNDEKEKTSSEIAFNELMPKDSKFNVDNIQLDNTRLNSNNLGKANNNNKSYLNVSNNNAADKKNTSNNLIKSKLIDNVVKSKNMKNLTNALMNKKKNKDIV